MTELAPSPGRPTDPSEIGRIHRLASLARSWICSGDTILDYGCGNEVVSSAIRSRGYIVHAEDQHNIGSNPGPYVAATCFDVLEHCEDPSIALDSIRSRLYHTGGIVLTVPNRWWLFETHASRPWNRLIGFNWGPWRHWLRRKVGRNVPAYTKGEVRRMLGEAGFYVVSAGYMTAPLDNAPLLRKLVWNWHRTKIPFFAVEIYAVAIKPWVDMR